MKLTVDLLIHEAEMFCARCNSTDHPELLGINDGKTIGTYIEHEFKKYLLSKYDFTLGNSASGIDFPEDELNTDLKVTSLSKPQNSCPFVNIRQKVYGLGYNILLFVYEKSEEDDKCYLFFDSCTFIEKNKTSDYNITSNLIKMVENCWSKEKIVYYLSECNLPGDESSLSMLADEILSNPPELGVLTLSNAFQWRVKYTHTDLNTSLPEVNVKKEFGDYQTPPYFARDVLDYVNSNYSLNPEVVIEPTCGVGNFIKAASICYPESEFVGIDINKSYLDEVNHSVHSALLFNSSVFEFDFGKIKRENIREYLLLGNPPWVTNTRLSKYDSDNVPDKSNIKSHDFFSASTGMSNFDISENILLRLVDEFMFTDCSMIFLCKFNVACNVFKYLFENSIKVSVIDIVRFDSMNIFNVDVSSCILVVQFKDGCNSIHSFCDVHDLDNPNYESCMGFVDGMFYSNLDNIVDIDGTCCFEWRQGIKHDCANIMELSVDGEVYVNKRKDVVSLEDDLLYPLLKSSDVKVPLVTDSSRRILITQHVLKEDTSYIKTDYPLTWKYLSDNSEYFSNRKSNIYANAPEYSIFGIGEYTFKKYKVAVSGFYKEGMFSLVYDDKAMMFDDTCYYLSFDDHDSAYITMLILNSWVVKSFLKSIVIMDSKRPYTKKVLKRIDIAKALNLLSFNDLTKTEKELGLTEYVNAKMFNKYKMRIITH